MSKSSNSSELQRKEPRQGRAKATVAAILEATAQVLVAEGYARMNTTKIALRAGVSVGTLYQYFADKDALVRCLMEHHTARMFDAMQQAASASVGQPLPTRIGALIEALVAAKAAEGPLCTVLVTTVLELEGGSASALDEALAVSRDMVRALLEEHAHELDPCDPELAASTLVHAIDGVIDAWLLAPERYPDEQALARELKRLANGYLWPGRPG